MNKPYREEADLQGKTTRSVCDVFDVSTLRCFWALQVVLSKKELDVKSVIQEKSLNFQYRFGLLIYIL